MRIVHYQQQLQGPESGTANAGRGWCEALARLGVHVAGLVDGDNVIRPAPQGIETIPLRHSLHGALRMPHGVAEHIVGADAVVVHGGWLLGNITVGRACVRAKVPFIVTAHGVYVREVLTRRRRTKLLWAAALERRHLRDAAALHVFFPEERTSTERTMKIRVNTIVAPNGIAYPEGVEWDGGSGGYLLWLGRFDPTTKGLDLLLRAIQQIPATERPLVRLHGPDWRDNKERVRALAVELGVDRSVTIGDPIFGDEKWDLIRRAAGCIYPSRWDACPVAVAEAAAVGVPMLVTRYPLANFLASRDAAIQVDPDASSIAEGIPQLMSSKASVVGGNAADVARHHLSWDAVARSWLEQLQRRLDPRPRTRRRDE